MILSEIKDYLQAQGQASLKDIADKFDLTESALQEMLAHWERKGKIGRLDSSHCVNPCGQKCSSCPLQCLMIYQWKQPDQKS